MKEKRVRSYIYLNLKFHDYSVFFRIATIKQFNKLLLTKCELYTIDGSIMSHIDTIIKTE